jgi:hypothetical protein
MYTEAQIEQISELSKAKFFAEVQENAALSQNALNVYTGIKQLIKASNMIFVLENVGSSDLNKNKAASELNGMRYTNVQLQDSYMESGYDVNGYSY